MQQKNKSIFLDVLKKAYKVTKIFLHSNKDWRVPKHSKILVYDASGSDILFNYIDKAKSQILFTRGERFNIPVIFLSKFTFKSYIDKYIKIVNPEFVITFIDNNVLFYLLKNQNSKITFIFIQNGLRGERGDVFRLIGNVSQKMKVDFMLTFNKSIGNEYLKYISGNVIPIGSLKNNYYSKTNLPKNKSIVFVSQYSNPPKTGPRGHFQFANKISVSWNDVYEAERRVLVHLARYCKKNNFKLTIVGRCIPSDLEFKFYNECIVNFNEWEFIASNPNGGNYSLIDASQCVVGIDSTLLYEAYAKEARVAFFSCRGGIIGDRNIGKFAWPSELKDVGPFWTSEINIIELTRVMDYVINSSDKEWSNDYKKYAPYVMDYDPGNKKTIAFFKKIKLPLNKKYV